MSGAGWVRRATRRLRTGPTAYLAILGLIVSSCGGVSATDGPPTVTGLTTGRQHTCALISNGNVVCWGDQIAVGGGPAPDFDRNQISPPVAVSLPTGLRATAVASGAQGGGYSTCALSDEGAAWCWGWGNDGQLGDGLGEYSFVPVAVAMPDGVRFDSIDVGAGHACALAEGGTAWCWGANDEGELGDGTKDSRFRPVAVSMPDGVSFSSITAAGNHTCALSIDGTAWCWGWGRTGELGDGTGKSHTAPAQVAMPAGVRFSSITAGGFHTCALSADGNAWCWGTNADGVLGDGTIQDASVPIPVTMPAGRSFTTIDAGDSATCAVADDGSIWCWGFNESGIVGDGTVIARAAPVEVAAPADVTFSAVALGEGHACAVATDASGVWCWGVNASGQLGDGTTADRSAPVAVAGAPGVWALIPSPPPSPTPLLEPVVVEPFPDSAFRSPPPLWGLTQDATLETLDAFSFGLPEDAPWPVPAGCWDQRNQELGEGACLYAVFASQGVSREALSLLDTHGVVVFKAAGEGPLWTVDGYSLANYGTNFHGDGTMIFGPSGIIAASLTFQGDRGALEAALASTLDERVQAAEAEAWGPEYGFYLGDPEDIVIPTVAPTRTSNGWEVLLLSRASSGFHCCQYQFVARFMLEFDAAGVQTGVRFVDWCYDARETFSDASGGPSSAALQKIADIGATLPTC